MSNVPWFTLAGYWGLHPCEINLFLSTLFAIYKKLFGATQFRKAHRPNCNERKFSKMAALEEKPKLVQENEDDIIENAAVENDATKKKKKKKKKKKGC